MCSDEPPKKFVIYRGQRMIERWPEKIEEAQIIKFYNIGGKQYERIKYGHESNRQTSGNQPCRDCAVLAEEFHVPGCDMEECPKCHEQALGCDCTLKITALH